MSEIRINTDEQCLFCGGDTGFMATITGKVCLSCGDKLQVQGIMLVTKKRYETLTQTREVLADQLTRWHRIIRFMYKHDPCPQDLDDYVGRYVLMLADAILPDFEMPQSILDEEAKCQAATAQEKS